MIEYRTLPSIYIVTDFTIAWEPHLRMVRIRGAVEVLGVTAVAVRRQPRELVTDMTGITVDGGVTTGQGEEIMIEDGTLPGIDGMAGLAFGGQEPGRCVLRIGGGVKIRLMTGGAVGRKSGKYPATMTLITVDSSMSSL